MGKTETLIFDYAMRQMRLSFIAGRSTLNGLGVGRTEDAPKLFAAGSELWQVAAGISGKPLHETSLEPQNQQLEDDVSLTEPTRLRQGE